MGHRVARTGWILAAAAGALAVLVGCVLAAIRFIPTHAETIREQTDLAKPGEARAETVESPTLTPASTNARELEGANFESVELSPDGELAYLSGAHERVTAFDTASGEVAFETDFATEGMAALSPDGTFLAAVRKGPDPLSSESVVLADATTGEELREIDGPDGYSPVGTAFTPDGELVISNSDDGTTLWDPGAGEQTGTVTNGGGDSSGSMAVSSDGSLIAYLSEGAIAVWTAEGEKAAEIDVALAPEDTHALGFQPGTSLLTAYTHNGIQFRDPISNEDVGSVPKNGHLPGLEYHPDGHMLLEWGGSGDDPVTAVNADTRTDAGALELPRPDGARAPDETLAANDVRDLTFSSDGDRLAAAATGSDAFYLWDVD